MPSRGVVFAVLGLLSLGGVGVLAALGVFDAPAPSSSAPVASAPAAPPLAAGVPVADPAPGAPPASQTAAVEPTAPADAPSAAPSGAPSEDTTWLLSQLRSANGFRARSAAALALGRRRGARVAAGLIEALRDDHPAVRTAVASALSRFDGEAVKRALREAQERERDAVAARALGRARDTPVQKQAAQVPSPTARGGVYVSVSRPRAQGTLDAGLLERADAAARAHARRLPGARIAPPGESAAAAEAVLRAEGRAGYQLDVTLGVEPSGAGARATANVLVATYPGRSIRGFAKGAATASGDPQDPELQRMAIEHAIASAFSDLPRMFQSSGP